MKIEIHSSDDQVGFKLIAENSADKAILAVFDFQNSKADREIKNSSKYDCDISAVTEIYIYGQAKAK